MNGQGEDMRFEIVWVTPEMAQAWLQTNIKNRKVNWRFVDQLVKAINEDRWILTHQGIAFDARGFLADGQHRLNAIVRAGKAVRMAVAWNLAAGSILSIDQNRPRSLPDALTIGTDLGSVCHHRVAAFRAMMEGVRNKSERYQPDVASVLMRKHWAALDFAMTNLSQSKPKLVDASMRGAVARAWYSTNHQKLERFCQVINDQVATADDERVIATLIKSLTAYSYMEGGSFKAERMKRIERGLYAYIVGQRLEKIYGTDKELFPLPGEKAQAA